MTSSQLNQVRRKFIALMRSDPPPPIMGLPREPLAPIFDRWVAHHFSGDEVAVLFELEHQYGERAMVDWFAEVLLEAGSPGPGALAN
jgi:hypothetical protein